MIENLKPQPAGEENENKNPILEEEIFATRSNICKLTKVDFESAVGQKTDAQPNNENVVQADFPNKAYEDADGKMHDLDRRSEGDLTQEDIDELLKTGTDDGHNVFFQVL